MEAKTPRALLVLGSPLGISRRSVLRVVAGLAGVALVGLAVLMLIEAALFPWARSLTGGPTLTGGWYGELTAPTLGTQRVYIDLWGNLGGRCYGCSRIDGTARICDSSGAVREFDIDGDPTNWRGTAFRMSTGRVDNRDGEGVQLGEVEGEWADDTIRATATLLFYNVEGGAARATARWSRDDRPSDSAGSFVPLILRRGSERDFLAACTQLREPGQAAGR